ncbi:hypothetical protein TNCV_216451 [Trichonephila clavipes]|nr:hypothetical protein TNCV_216451 [Trichonephila clavipes]
MRKEAEMLNTVSCCYCVIIIHLVAGKPTPSPKDPAAKESSMHYVAQLRAVSKSHQCIQQSEQGRSKQNEKIHYLLREFHVAEMLVSKYSHGYWQRPNSPALLRYDCTLLGVPLVCKSNSTK